MSLRIGPGTAVLTTPFTFFATAGTIARLGARPVFADTTRRHSTSIRSGGKTNDVNEKKGTRPPVKAILPVIFTPVRDMDDLISLAAQNGVAVIEDAAQAIGADYPPGEALSVKRDQSARSEPLLLSDEKSRRIRRRRQVLTNEEFSGFN
jgi:dTDP-4-amino-4,6-dideoxygalactose transaminase